MSVGKEVKGRKQTQEGGREVRGAGASIPKVEIGGPGERTLTALQRDGPCRCRGRN